MDDASSGAKEASQASGILSADPGIADIVGERRVTFQLDEHARGGDAEELDGSPVRATLGVTAKLKHRQSGRMRGRIRIEQSRLGVIDPVGGKDSVETSSLKSLELMTERDRTAVDSGSPIKVYRHEKTSGGHAQTQARDAAGR